MDVVGIAARLRALARRVNTNLPLNGDPERFHAEKSELAYEMRRLANELAPVIEKSTITISMVETINKRTVIVQRKRLPFAISV